MEGVSVIVCCFNSAERIDETLSFLLAQQVVGFPWEIIVVNNRSTDHTVDVVNKVIQNSKANHLISLTEEQQPGLLYARQKGIVASKYEVLIFCDDDNHLNSQFVQQAFVTMKSDSSIMVAGGIVKPKLPFYPGKWIEANYAALAIGARGAMSGEVDWVFGAGMVVRKEMFSILESRGFKLLLTGRVGKRQTSGDDAELCRFARFMGYKVYFSQDLVLDHKISGHRLSRWNFITANYKNVYMMVYFYLLDELMKDRSRPVTTLYFKFLTSRIRQVFYFLPRVFLSKNHFFCFMMLFQNVQLLAWIFLKRKSFADTARQISQNLYHG